MASSTRTVDNAEPDPAGTTITYCLVGWRASVAGLTLTWLGFSDARVYDGPWLEWGAGGFPIETD